MEGLLGLSYGATVLTRDENWQVRVTDQNGGRRVENERLGQGVTPLIDKVDCSLIEALQRNGRAPYADLAEAAGVAEKTARRRVARLLHSKTVRVTAVTHPSVLGYGAMAMLNISLADGARAESVAHFLLQHQPVDYVTTTAGRFALRVEIVCRNNSEMIAFIEDVVRTTEGVGNVDVLPYLQLVFYQPRFHGTDVARDGRLRSKPLESIDRQIIGQLALDGRAPYKSVADAVGVSQAMARHRTRRLFEEDVLRITAFVNPLVFDFRATAWVDIKISPGFRSRDVAEKVASLSGVSYIALTAGRCDLLVEVVCARNEDLQNLLDEGVRTIEGIRDIEVTPYYSLLYKPLLPLISYADE